MSRTSLIVVMYHSRAQTDCSPDEHSQIVAAIAEGDAARPAELKDILQ